MQSLSIKNIRETLEKEEKVNLSLTIGNDEIDLFKEDSSILMQIRFSSPALASDFLAKLGALDRLLSIQSSEGTSYTL